ncbi:MAG: hypothetical protein ACHQIG_06450 [Acidimicrobiia bacterium]
MVVLALIALALALTAGPAEAQTSSQAPPPFASGMVSSLSGSTLKLQTRTGASATVVVTDSTSYQQTQSATASNIAKGDCVRVIGTGSTTSGIQATTVAITKPTSKGCTQPTQANNGGGFGGAGGTGRRFGNGTGTGGPPSGFTPSNGTGATAPDGNGSTPPNGSGFTRPTNFGFAFGTVTAVSGDQLTVKAQVPASTTGSGTKSTTKKPKTKTEQVDVTLAGTTTETQTVKADVSALVAGVCVNANGTADSLGTVTAKSVTVSQPQNGSCSGGFGRFGGGGFRGGASASPSGVT